MGRLIKPKVNRIFQTKIEQLTLDLSKRSTCTVVIETHVECPNCEYDLTQKASSGKYKTGGPKPFTSKSCPVCKTKGKIVETATHNVEANVKWGRGDKPNTPKAQGWLPEGMVRMKALVRHYEIFKNATYFLIDNIRCSPEGQPKKRGLQSYVIVEAYAKIDV